MEHLKLTVETLTPVHVGSGQTLTKGFDFIKLNDKNIGFVNLNKLGGFLDKEKIELFTQAIQKNQSVPDFIKTHLGAGISEEKYIDKKLTLFAKTDYYFLKEQFHTAIKGATVPGSSLKGALKTALWRYLADDNFLQKIALKDLRKFNQSEKKIKWEDINIEKKLFGQDPNHKLTRFLSVSDMHFGDATEVHEIGILNLYKKYKIYEWDWKKDARFLAETIKPKSRSSLTINLKKDWKNKNIQKEPYKWKNNTLEWLDNPHSFFKIINNFTINRIDNELEDLKDLNFCTPPAGKNYLTTMEEIKNEVTGLKNGFIIRIGGNIGWEFITGGWIRKSSIKCLSYNENEEYWALKKKIQKNKDYDTDIWGKTRKMTYEGIPLGFIKVTL